ncbi:MAG: hypothetical protein Q8936_09220 [Bacillota bacterium]|nr:hypothetical protein [Bacillota bacterium]
MSYKDDRNDIKLNEARNLNKKERSFASADSAAMTHIDKTGNNLKSRNGKSYKDK